ncbi:hypothetical protein TSUD_346110 [Trifolium subterraneum]|nr:hypothetical protein TSUD_346110 [Trifolium subterraneum]
MNIQVIAFTSWLELGIGLVPYCPLGAGFFGGKAITERTTKIKNLESNIGSFQVKLNKDDLKEIEETVPISEVMGSRTTDALVRCSWRFANTPPKA